MSLKSKDGGSSKKPMYFQNQPGLSKDILLSSYYDELQKNNWANIIDDDTDDLTLLIHIKSIDNL